MLNIRVRNAVRLVIAMSAAAAGSYPSLSLAQERAAEADSAGIGPTRVAAAAPGTPDAPDTGSLDAVIVSGRQHNAAANLVQERIEQPVLVDLVSSEQISRVGDSSVSFALRRMPGVSLVGDQFIYIRGLGERYSSTTLNGAIVPSPDLTRNVIPLDIFPSEILESLSVQKGYTADRPAAFGGGNVDIRTRSVPDDFRAQFQVGTGWNTEGEDNVLTYPGGGDDRFGTDDGTRAMPAEISDAIQQFQGQFDPVSIYSALLRDGQPHTYAEAEAINRSLGLSLNRNVDFIEESTDPDLSLEASVGNKWELGDSGDWRAGFIALGDYKNQWRNRTRTTQSVQTPELDRGTTQRSIHQVSVTGSLGVGLEFAEDQKVDVTGIYLRNTEDETALTMRNNFNFRRDQGRQLRDYRIRYEERDLEVLQVNGSHTLGDATLGAIDLGAWTAWLSWPIFKDLNFSWKYSDATAATDIPNEVTISAVDDVDPASGEVLATSVRSTTSAADYRFTELEDQVTNYGWKLTRPFEWNNFTGSLSGGYDRYEKARSYLQTQLGLGTTTLAAGPILVGTPGQVFTDANLTNPANGFLLTLGGIGTESYLAGEIVTAGFGALDVTWNEAWRVTGGARWEEFQQVVVPVDPLQFDTAVPKVPLSTEELYSLAKNADDIYPTVALTHMRKDFWADDFQLRFGWSETTARPDLREVSDATYIDPFTDARVRGNPMLFSSMLTNYDMRAEWFFGNGDNFTISLFYKDIVDPIETVEGAGTDNNLSFTFINAESAEVSGVEIEWLKDLSGLDRWLGGWVGGFFTAGNITISESEIVVGSDALNVTNNTRALTQHSDLIFNIQLGYDSPSGKHSSTLIYNSFSERILFGGRAGAPDAYEQPFESLDLVYTWYPSETWNMKLRLQNLLDSQLEVQQGDVIVLEQTIGMTAKLDLTVRF